MSAYGPGEEWICEVQHETPETPESRPFLILMHKLERKPRHRVGKALRDWVAKYGITGMDYRAIRIMDGCKMVDRKVTLRQLVPVDGDPVELGQVGVVEVRATE